MSPSKKRELIESLNTEALAIIFCSNPTAAERKRLDQIQRMIQYLEWQQEQQQ